MSDSRSNLNQFRVRIFFALALSAFFAVGFIKFLINKVVL